MKKIFLLGLAAFYACKSMAQPDSESFVEKILSIPVSGCRIEGTLLDPGKLPGKQKLAIIIAGSGPTDRNGNSALGVSANTYKLLAEALAKEHIGTFRYDKRAIGKSGLKNFKESALVFEDYISDAEMIFDYLKDSLGYQNIFIVGHSEGSLIGMVAAAHRPVLGFISLSGAGRPIDKVIDQQLSSQPAYVREKVDSLFVSLRSGKKIDSVPPYLYSIFRPSVQPYMISWLKYDPAAEMGKLNCPALIVQGTCDVQVTLKDAYDLSQSCKNGNLDIVRSMTHTLKNTDDDCQDTNRKTYTDASLPLNSQMVKDLVSFIKGNG